MIAQSGIQPHQTSSIVVASSMECGQQPVPIAPAPTTGGAQPYYREHVEVAGGHPVQMVPHGTGTQGGVPQTVESGAPSYQQGVANGVENNASSGAQKRGKKTGCIVGVVIAVVLVGAAVPAFIFFVLPMLTGNEEKGQKTFDRQYGPCRYSYQNGVPSMTAYDGYWYKESTYLLIRSLKRTPCSVSRVSFYHVRKDIVCVKCVATHVFRFCRNALWSRRHYFYDSEVLRVWQLMGYLPAKSSVHDICRNERKS